MPASHPLQDLQQLDAWTGRSETLHDEVAAAPMAALAATLDRAETHPAAGTPLPPLWHWLYFLPTHLARDLGPDGHGRRGGFLPPVPLPRRMWAGSRISWETANPLRVGDRIRRESRIEQVRHKRGRSGALVFVTISHVIHNAGGVCVREEQDIVYRDAPQPSDPAPSPMTASEEAAWRRELVPDETLLFRYSALTFNAHRIHYDRRYAMQQEGYPGLVVHGPLTATLLMDLLHRQAPPSQVRRFEFQAMRPAFDGQVLRLSGQPGEGGAVRLQAQDSAGGLTLRAHAEVI